MAIESPINPEHGWFIGEDKALRFTIDGIEADDPMTGWRVAWSLYPRRREEVVMVKSTTDGSVTVLEDGKRLLVRIIATDTAGLGEGTYRYVLRRTDPGKEQVLAYGAAVLRTPVAA